jgi:hypothetical protein
MILVCLVFLLNGLSVAYLTFQQFSVRISIVDIILLPIMMRLWGYLVPFRGGLMFSALLLKMKYKVKLSGSLSVGLYTFLITLVLSGCFGLYYMWTNDMLLSIGTLVSICLIISPLLVKAANVLLSIIPINQHILLTNVKTFCETTIDSSLIIFKNYKNNIAVLLLTVANIFIYIVWIYWATVAFNMVVAIDKIIILALVLKLSIVTRLVPGNLGVQELAAGGAFYMLGGTIEEGIWIALFIRLSSMILVFTIGVLGVVANTKYLNVSDLREMWILLNKKETNAKL